MTIPKTTILLANYEKAVTELVEHFVEIYFKCKLQDCEYWWVGGDVGDMLCINDNFFDFSTIKTAFNENITVEMFWRWYSYTIADKDPINEYPINLHTYNAIGGNLEVLNRKE